MHDTAQWALEQATKRKSYLKERKKHNQNCREVYLTKTINCIIKLLKEKTFYNNIKPRRKEMNKIEEYRKADNCYTGEVDGYGYAFVPGSKKGVVLTDLRTRVILENPALFQEEKDLPRIKLLLENELIRPKNTEMVKPKLEKERIKGMSTWLHIANQCNLRCPYCYITNKGRSLMSFPVATAYLDKLEQTVRKHDLNLITIRFAGGEPTLHKPLIKFLTEQVQKRFVAKGVRSQLILLTNGTLLDRDLIALIKDNSVRVCMSLDGLEEWHDKTRFFGAHKGSFERVKKGLDMCLGNNLSPTVLTTITDKNLAGIPMLSRFLIDTSISFRYGLYRDNVGDFRGYEEFMKKTEDILNDSYDYYAHAIRNHNTSAMHQLCEIHLDRKPHLRGCNIGYSGVTVDHNGNVYVCQARMDKEPIGNLESRESFLEMVWAQNTFPELNSKDVLDYKGCRDCQWALICGGGCPVINYGANGAAASSSPYCKFFKAMIPRLIELKALQLLWGHLKRKEVM